MVASNVVTHRPGLDDFLYAAIGEEGNGMSLTVVSALGRLGFDPWIQADRFSAMSKAAAAQLLGPMLARLPKGLWSADAQSIADRLVELLPAPLASTAPNTRKPVPIASWLLGVVLVVMLIVAVTAGRDLSLGRLLGSPPATFSVDDPQPGER
jgi:hypothetical protein